MEARVIYLAHQNDRFKQQIDYTFNLIFSLLGVPWKVISYEGLAEIPPDPGSLVISYGKNKSRPTFPHQIHIYESSLFSSNYLKPESLPTTPLPRFRNLPVIYAGRGNLSDWVVIRETGFRGRLVETNIDIVASSFFMVTRYEEVLINTRDKFDRFLATASLAYKEGFLDRPIVNEYIEMLWGWIEGFNLGFTRKKLWGDKDFAVCLTHDVDAIRKYKIYPPLRTIGSLALKQKKPKRAFDELIGYIKAKFKNDPYNSFEHIAELERKYGFVSSFYFMSSGDNKKYDSRYSVDSPYLTSLIKRLKDKGCEVGLHGSFNSYNDFEILQFEKKSLQKITGNSIAGERQHYLRWKTPDTWRILEKVGLKYDITLGFAEHEGFSGWKSIWLPKSYPRRRIPTD